MGGRGGRSDICYNCHAGSLGENPALVEVAQAAYEKLERVAQSL